MGSIAEINRFLQNKLDELNMHEVNAVTAAQWLEETGILNDSVHRPGLPLRRYLRSGKISSAYQYPNRRWVIRRGRKENVYSIREAAEKLGLTEQAIYKRIERDNIKYEKLGERSFVIPESEITKEQKARNMDVDVTGEGQVQYHISSLKQQMYHIKEEIEKMISKMNEIEKVVSSREESMMHSTIEDLKNNGYDGFYNVTTLSDSKIEVPRVKGIYLVLYPSENPVEFMEDNSGGHFKGKNPSVSIDSLRAQWVENSIVVYIGQAGGGNSKATLKSRIRQLLDFANGKPVGHWGGRQLWQIQDSHQLVICWKTFPDDDPKKIEQIMLRDFVAEFGVLPFANLTA
jgi:excisionase family DNA binding protein